MQVAGGTVLAGWSGVDLTAAELPPGVYEPSRDHLGHALAGHPIEPGGETELVQVRTGAFQPAFFSPDQYRAITQLVAVLLGESPDAAIVHDVAEWIDLTVSESANIRAAARALSPPYRTLGLHFYGTEEVRHLEEFDAQTVVRKGLAWLSRITQDRGGFLALEQSEQTSIVSKFLDPSTVWSLDLEGVEFFSYLKARVADGFYTSRAGLDELGYRGNAFYASPPGCEHLYG